MAAVPSSVQNIFPGLTLLVGLLSLYYIGLGLWRVYFSPISKFPGPTLAALTYWYEFYYDCIQRGQFIYKIRDLHEQYGPIIRINPHELHVADPAFYHTLYAAGSQKRNRDPYHASSLTLNGSVLASPDCSLHRKRRAALSPFFSAQNTRRLLPLVQERVEVLVAKLEELKDTGKIVNLLHAYAAFSNDVISEYLFGSSEHRLEAENFDPSYHHMVMESAAATINIKHFPILPVIINALPDFVTDQLGAVVAQKKMKKFINGLIEDIRHNGSKKTSGTTIFHTLLESDLPPSEKATARLTEEGITVVGAGSHTVASALTVGTFHILSTPLMLSNLRAELSTVNRKGQTLASILSQLEKLPYLTGIIKESLRLTYGTSLRLPRIDPEKPMQFQDWTIPPGTPVAMTAALLHHDESIFPESRAFKPERWVEDEGGLDRYMVSFSGGSRICLGMTLAWAELYVAYDGVFRGMGGERGVMSLVGTDTSDVEIVGDGFFPLVKEGSKGVRVLISS